MFVTPISACIVHAIISCGGVGQQSALHVISVWFSTLISWISHEYSQTALETCEPFHLGIIYILPHTKQ